MPITDPNDPAAHCLGLSQPRLSGFEYGHPSKAPASHRPGNTLGSKGGPISSVRDEIKIKDTRTSDSNSERILFINQSQPPPSKGLDYEDALWFLFNECSKNLQGVELCQAIELIPTPPLKAGVLHYLFRMKEIGRLREWPLLFGQQNMFILNLLEKMTRSELAPTSKHERAIWEERKSETKEWMYHSRRSLAQTLLNPEA